MTPLLSSVKARMLEDFKPVAQVPDAIFAPLHHREAVGVGADPQAVPAVHKEASYAGDAVCGIQALEGVAVIANQSGIAADPNEALAGFGNGIGIGGGQAVSVVLQYGGKALCAPGGIHAQRYAFGLGRTNKNREKKDQNKPANNLFHSASLHDLSDIFKVVTWLSYILSHV